MEDQELLIRRPLQDGRNRILDIGEHGMKLTRFGILRLPQGASASFATGEFEAAIVVLGGKCAVRGRDFAFPEVGARRNVFDGKPHTVYLPRRTEYTVEALTPFDAAVNESPASRDTAPPTLIGPERTRVLSLGRDNFTRAATIILDETFDSEHFYIGEGMIPSGNWSGYPPHRHDHDDPPAEIDMEETYFYRFDPECGFGFQRVYQPDGSLDVSYAVRHDDTVAIAAGYHPLCGAPGYRMYYLWTMCGAVNRGLVSAMDPRHAWVAKA